MPTNLDEEISERGTLRASDAIVVRAPKARVMTVLLEYRDWPKFFPTIADVRLLDAEDGRLDLEVDHREGKVRNVLTVVSPDEVRLEEFKRRYDAVFLYRFEEVSRGTRLTVAGAVTLRGRLGWVAPLLRPLMRRQLRRYVLAPMKVRAESHAGADPGVGHAS